MADKTEEPQTPPAKPVAFLILQGVIVVGIVVLAAFDLARPDGDVPWVVYGVLAGIAGGPEVLERLTPR